MNTKKLLGQKIKEYRKMRGLTQDSLSELINIEPKHLSRIEVGNSYPSLDTLDKIAGHLKVDLKDLFDFTGLEKSSKEIRKEINGCLEKLDKMKLYSAMIMLKEFSK